MSLPRQVVGRFGTAVLDDAAPADLEARILELLGGPRPQEMTGGDSRQVTTADTQKVDAAHSQPTALWIDPDDLPARTVACAADTGVWVDPDDARADLRASSLGDAPRSPADRFPEPEPGSGRRRRRPAALSPDGPPGGLPATPDGLDAPPPPPGRRAGGAPGREGAAPSAGARAPAATELLTPADAAGRTGAFTPPPADGPQIMAAICGAGHPNPPDAPACHSCTAPLTGELRLVPRPVLAVLLMAGGESVPVRGDVVVGRAPQAQPGGEPGTTLLAVTSPTHLVSRSHLSLTTAGWNVLARDLGSNNGTVLVRPGQIPVLLATALPTPLYVGDLLDLGDGVTLRVEPPL